METETNFFSFFDQEETTHLLNLLIEMDDTSSFDNGGVGKKNVTKKRQRKEYEDTENNAGFNDILASMMFFKDETKPDRESEITVEVDHDHDHDDYEQIETRSSEINDSVQSGNKRARVSSSPETVSLKEESGSRRRLWVKERATDWWDRVSDPAFPDNEFKAEFRMSKSTFEMICFELESAVTKKNTTLRDAIPVRQRVAVCIYRLATGEPLRLVSKRFGLGISTCHKLVLEVCSAIRTVLMPKFLQWPESEAKLNSIKQDFESISQIPNVIGSIYTTHLAVVAPKTNVASYFNKRHTERNQKSSYSITVQGVVDSTGVFTDICIGYPGSMSNADVLEKSALSKRATSLKNVWIAGKVSYPLTDWVMVPYAHQNLTWTQHAFNEKIGEIEKIAENAFSRLKSRWGCLQKRTEVKLQDLPVLIGACCVLHNICELRNEELFDSEFKIFDDVIVEENSVRSVSSLQARDQIAHNLLHHGLAGTSFL